MNWYIWVIWAISLVLLLIVSGYLGHTIGYAKGRKDGDKARLTKGPKEEQKIG